MLRLKTIGEVRTTGARKTGNRAVTGILAVGLLMPAADLPRELRDGATLPPGDTQWVERGGSAIIGPDTHYVLDPVFDREELLVADLDLTQIDREMMTLDVSGHYARPDIFRFEKKEIQANLTGD